jgi:hypothetical protein
MASSTEVLEKISEEFALAVPEVDSRAEHGRWKPGIGPFEEERQVEMLVEETQDVFGGDLKREVDYLASGQACDLVYDTEELRLPIEAKLIRFRYDNGNIDPNTFPKIFSPFPEGGSSSLLTDAEKLCESGFDLNGGLLGIYYERENEEYDEMDAEKIAEKFRIDTEYWCDLAVEVTKVVRFDGLRHPHHERGAVITWKVLG